MKKVTDQDRALEHIVKHINEVKMKEISRIIDRMPLREIIQTYPRAKLSFVTRQSEKKFFYSTKNKYVDLESLDSEKLLRKSLLDIQPSFYNIGALILKLLEFIYHETWKNIEDFELNIYHNPSLIVGHNFIAIGKKLSSGLPASIRLTLQRIEEYYNDCLDILEEGLDLLPDSELFYIEAPKMQYFDSSDLFLCLIFIYWLIILDSKNHIKYISLLRQFLDKFLKFNNPKKDINFYLKTSFRYHLVTNFKNTVLLPNKRDNEILSSIDENELNDKNLNVLYDSLESSYSKLFFLEKLVEMDTAEVRRLFFRITNADDVEISDFSIQKIDEKGWQPETETEILAYNAKKGNWDEIVSVNTEEALDCLLNELKRRKDSDVTGKEWMELNRDLTDIVSSIGLLTNVNTSNALQELTAETNRYISYSAILAMGKEGSDKSIEYLYILLDQTTEDNDKLKYADTIILALINTNNVDVTDFLLKQIKEKTALQYVVLSNIGYSKDPRVIDFLIDMLDNAKHNQSEIVLNLARTRDSRALDKIIDYTEQAGYLSHHVFKELGKIKSEKILTFLKRTILEHGSIKMRTYALSAFEGSHELDKALLLFDLYEKLELELKVNIALSLCTMKVNWKKEHIEKKYKILLELLDTLKEPEQLLTLFQALTCSEEGRLFPKLEEVKKQTHIKNAIRFNQVLLMHLTLASKNLERIYDEQKDLELLELEKSSTNSKEHKKSILTKEQELQIQNLFVESANTTMDPKSAGKLVEIFEDYPIGELRERIRFVLKRISEKTSQETIMKLLEDKDDVIKKGAIHLAGLKKLTDTSELLINLINDKGENPQIRKQAITAIFNIDKKRFFPTLEKCLDSDIFEVRAQAATELLNLSAEEIISTEYQYVDMLASRGTSVLSLIFEIFENKSTSLNYSYKAGMVVAKLGDSVIPILTDKLRKTEDRNLKLMILDVFNEFEDTTAIQVIVDMFKEVELDTEMKRRIRSLERILEKDEVDD